MFFLSILMVRGEAASMRREASRGKNNRSSLEPYQTVSTVYFILGILRTDLWSQGTGSAIAKAIKNLVKRAVLYVVCEGNP